MDLGIQPQNLHHLSSFLPKMFIHIRYSIELSFLKTFLLEPDLDGAVCDWCTDGDHPRPAFPENLHCLSTLGLLFPICSFFSS